MRPPSPTQRRVAIGADQLTDVVASELCPALGATVTLHLPMTQLYEVRP